MYVFGFLLSGECSMLLLFVNQLWEIRRLLVRRDTRKLTWHRGGHLASGQPKVGQCILDEKRFFEDNA